MPLQGPCGLEEQRAQGCRFRPGARGEEVQRPPQGPQLRRVFPFLPGAEAQGPRVSRSVSTQMTTTPPCPL